VRRRYLHGGTRKNKNKGTGVKKFPIGVGMTLIPVGETESATTYSP